MHDIEEETRPCTTCGEDTNHSRVLDYQGQWGEWSCENDWGGCADCGTSCHPDAHIAYRNNGADIIVCSACLDTKYNDEGSPLNH